MPDTKPSCGFCIKYHSRPGCVRLGPVVKGQRHILGLLHQGLQINEVLVSSKGGQRLIRGVSIARRAEGQNLPVPLPRLCQEVHKPTCGFPHGPNAVGAGQRCHMHQNTTCAHCVPSSPPGSRTLTSHFTEGRTILYQASLLFLSARL